MSSPFDTLPAPGRHRDITPADVVARPAGIRLVDVREPHEFVGELGHIAGANLVPLGVVTGHLGEWNKDEEIVFVCRSGGRSGRAATAFAEAGFTRTSNMLGGMLRWNDEGRPVER